MATQLRWQCHGFNDFTPLQLYEVLRLRDQVFVVEQQSIYGDVDGVDPHCWHLSGRDGDGRLLAYARLLPPGLSYPHAAAIGRVVIPAPLRGSGLGSPLMREALAQCRRLFPGSAVMLSAQADRVGYYQRFGFAPVSAPYDDGGILHLDMRRDGSQ